ncbi:MAG: xylulose kinase [Pseudonocardiales bacterium]|nr:xylulose kinase [Pseudonocardiales bacterium]
MRNAPNELFGRHPAVRSNELDEAKAALSAAFLPLDFPDPTVTAGLDVRLNIVKVGRIAAGYLRFGVPVGIRTEEATNYHVDIPLAGTALMRMGRREPVYGTVELAATFGPGQPATIQCESDTALLCLMIPKAELQLELENYLGQAADRPLEFDGAFDLNTAHGLAFMHAVRLLDAESQRDNGLLAHALPSHRLEQLLLETLLLSQPTTTAWLC